MKLNTEQRRVVESDSPAIMVMAAAGSGKTTTLVERIKRLLETGGVSPYEIMAITFTRKAASQLKERLAAFVPEQDLGKLYIGTSHSLCARIIRDYAELIGYGRNFGIYDETDQADILQAIIEDYKFKIKVRDLLEKISRAAKGELEGEQATVYSEYCARLKRHNALDYDLILDKAVEIVEAHPEALQHYRNRYRHVLYDEFQDLAELEDQLLLTLGIENSLVVGDYNQAIYSFRGCSNKYVLAYRERHPDCEIIKLPKNYRTVPEILRSAEILINKNAQPFGYYQLIPGRELDTKPGRSIYKFIDLVQEDSRVALQIREALKISGTPKDWAVLVRTNSQIGPLKDALESAEVPVQVVRRDDYWSREVVKNTLAYLRLIVNPKDDFSMRRILGLPYLNFSRLEIRKLMAEAASAELPLYEICKNSGEAMLEEVHLIANLIPQANIQTARAIFREFVKQSTYLKWLEIQGLKTKLSWALELEDRIADFEGKAENYDYSLQAFLESISLESAVDHYDESRNAVSLMTLHCAKGLEWPNVWIAGCEEGLTPLRSGELEEERRLFFVGVTRARDRLYLSSAGQRQKWGKVMDCKPSRFLEEMG